MLKETWNQGRFTKIDDQKAPRSFKELRGFLKCNGGNDCFSKSDGWVHKITRDGKWERLVRNIDMMSFEQYLNKSIE